MPQHGGGCVTNLVPVMGRDNTLTGSAVSLISAIQGSR